MLNKNDLKPLVDKKIVFISAPYRGETHAEVKHNIEAASQMAEEVWAAGGFAICPHNNTGFFSGICPERQFFDGYLEIVERCDVLYYDPKRVSEGVSLEIRRAAKKGLLILTKSRF